MPRDGAVNDARRVIILTEGNTDPLNAKTATSMVRYRTAEVVAILDSTQAGRTAGELLGAGDSIPIVASLDDAPAANELMIGISPSGGRVPAAWRATILAALERGMNVVSGLHDFLGDDPQLAAAAAQHGGSIYDVRKNTFRDVATRQGIRAGCLRIHTVGNDCSLGKMISAVEVARGLQRAGHDAKFVATGQTGIMIEGDGIPIDCVVSDFVNGAAERLVLDNQQHEIIVIEGQGSIVHPKYSAVSLGLLHGSLPDGLILCYEAGRKTVKGMDDLPLIPLPKVRELCEAMANVMHPCRVIGIGMNGRRLNADEAAAERERMQAEMGLPVCDVYRDGPDTLVAAVLDLQRELGK